MSLDPILSVQLALINHLATYAPLFNLIGNPPRIYDEVPTQTLYPYISFGRVQASLIGGLETDLTEQVLTLTCVSRFGGSEEVKSILAELRLCLDGVDLNLTDQVFISLRVSFIDVFRASDNHTIYGLMRLRCVTQTQ